MHHPEYSTVDPRTGNMTYSGPLEITKGDHSNMPPRTSAYLSGGDERGHINASSLGGTNSTINVAAQSRDVNHGAYYSMEQGERTALQSGAEINSTKTAVVNGSPGDRPEAFLVSDTITYADGHTENISLSFTNASYAEQAAYNELSASLPGTFDAPNPGDGLRGSMDPEAYGQLVEATDAELPGIAADYAPADFSGPLAVDPAADSAADLTSDAAAADADSAGPGADPDLE